MSEIEISDDEAAIIFGPDGQINLLLPEMEGAAMIPPHVLLAMAVGGRAIRDEAFRNECVEWLLRQREVQ